MKRKKRMKIEKEEQKKIEDVKRFDMKGLVRERKKVERNRLILFLNMLLS